MSIQIGVGVHASKKQAAEAAPVGTLRPDPAPATPQAGPAAEPKNSKDEAQQAKPATGGK